MSRLRPPEPNRQYLQAMETVDYLMKEINRALRLGPDDPDPGGFAAAVRPAEMLVKLLRVSAIAREKEGRDPPFYGLRQGR